MTIYQYRNYMIFIYFYYISCNIILESIFYTIHKLLFSWGVDIYMYSRYINKYWTLKFSISWSLYYLSSPTIIIFGSNDLLLLSSWIKYDDKNYDECVKKNYKT